MDSEEAVRIRESLPQAYPPGLQKSAGLTGKMTSPRPVENAAEMLERSRRICAREKKEKKKEPNRSFPDIMLSTNSKVKM